MTGYAYGMRLRGFSIGAQPSGVVDHYDDDSGKYWDVIVYDRELTPEEQHHYSLDYLGEREI